jgi:hypothetical protein
VTTVLPFLVGTVILLIAGLGKVRHPAGTAQALRTQRLPATSALVRALGVTEIAVATAALAGVGAAAWAVAALYLGFTGFVVLALTSGRPLSSCGCFGEADLPPTRTHVGVTAALALAAACAVLSGPTGLPALLALGPAAAAAGLAVTALLSALSLLTLTGLPRLVAARSTIRRTAT